MAAVYRDATGGGLSMKDAVGYLRVSTREQGRSGLGLKAQRFEIEAFGVREGFAVKSWYQDIQISNPPRTQCTDDNRTQGSPRPAPP
jgi:hypothetical protein